MVIMIIVFAVISRMALAPPPTSHLEDAENFLPRKVKNNTVMND
jgi:hypothetical protein